jgi:hydroxymethylpyrimidine pyrophosphatase-like HAD family hydrolase
MFIVLDLDQTLADNAHRAHFVEKEPKDWDSFLSPDRVIKDPVVAGAERVLEQLQALKYDLVILTGRHEDLRDATMRWLLEKLNITLPDTLLLMRPNGNMLNAAEYKREQLLNFRQGLENRDNNFLIIDDDAAAGEALKEFGIVLKAPECWELLFPIPLAEKQEE